MSKKGNKPTKSFESKYDPQKLWELIQEGKTADVIQKELGLASKQSLRQHVLRLINQDRTYYEIPGLYVRNLKRPMINFKGELRLTKKMINFPETTYKHGDQFQVYADNSRIILTRIVDTPVEQETIPENQETTTDTE